jgi:hypothetical protein
MESSEQTENLDQRETQAACPALGNNSWIRGKEAVRLYQENLLLGS